MFDISQLFISSAFAQQATGAPAATASTGLSGIVSPQMLMLLTLFAVWFFLVIRPQNKRTEEHAKMVKGLQRGDRVVTTSGIHGKIAKVEGEDHIMVEIAEGVLVKMSRSSIQALEAKTQPVADAEKK